MRQLRLLNSFRVMALLALSEQTDSNMKNGDPGHSAQLPRCDPMERKKQRGRNPDLIAILRPEATTIDINYESLCALVY